MPITALPYDRIVVGKLNIVMKFKIFVAALPYRYALVRKVREIQQAAISPLLDHLELGAQQLDLLIARPTLFLDGSDIEALTFGARDLITGGVLLPLQSFDLRQQTPPTVFKRRELLELTRKIGPACRETRTHGLGIVAQESRIDH